MIFMRRSVNLEYPGNIKVTVDKLRAVVHQNKQLEIASQAFWKKSVEKWGVFVTLDRKDIECMADHWLG